MSARTLLLDIGNSRIKAAWAGDHGLHALPTVAHEADAARALHSVTVEIPQAVWISHVLGPAVEAALVEAARSHWNLIPHFARSLAAQLGLRSGYAEPERLGVDRWLAMLAARTESQSAAVIVDAGTALTVDLIDDRGQHLGGIIAPGLLTAQRATLGATRFATRDLGAIYTAGVGRDTEACVRQGALLGCLGAIDRVVASADERARLLITGGDAALLLEHLSSSWRHRPELVLEGLRIAASAALES